MKPKKILFTTENTSWGGSELLWTKSVCELIKFGFEIYICVNKKLDLPKRIIEAEEKQQIKVFKIFNDTLPLIKRVLNRVVPFKMRFKLKNKREEYIKRIKPDLLIINQGYNFNGVDVMIYANKHNIKYVTISHAVNEGMWPNLKLRNKMMIGFTNSVKNYFVSDDNLAVTQSQIGSKIKNSEIVRNPFNVPYDLNIAYPIQSDYHLACVGRFDFFAKGQDVLLRVLDQNKWKQRNLIVNFYGSGSDEQNLKDLINLYEIKNAIVHSHTNTLDIWKQNQGLLLCSRFEGLPIVIVEAMLCKRFVITTNVSGNKELLTDNYTGFIAEAPRPEYVDDALERAWELRTHWENIGENARIEVLKRVPENPALQFAEKLNQILIAN